MIAKALVTLALTGALLIGGCAKNQDGSVQTPDWSVIAAQVREITRTTCGFLPTVQTVVDIIAVGQFTIPFTIANAICAAVTAPPQLRAGQAPTVSGVVIRGTFVRK